MSGRCECCNARLSNREAGSRFVTAPDEPKRYTNMCTKCVSFVGVPVIVPDAPADDFDDSVPFDYADIQQEIQIGFIGDDAEEE
jgi:hypothetical protein